MALSRLVFEILPTNFSASVMFCHFWLPYGHDAMKGRFVFQRFTMNVYNKRTIFELTAWDIQTDGRRDGWTAALLNAPSTLLRA